MGASATPIAPLTSIASMMLYGECPDCKRPRTAKFWCNICNITKLENNFDNWTSRNQDIDDFIRFTQLNASKSADYLEWIEFDKLGLVTNTNKRGAFSSIYSALWLEGPMDCFDEDDDRITRRGPVQVALKRLDNSLTVGKEYINQLYRYHRCLLSNSLVECFGITKDQTSRYMFVLKYYEQGDLYSYLDIATETMCWRQIVDILWEISSGLKFIHELGLIHGNLHGGNILVENETDSAGIKIADAGLHGPVNKETPSQQIYGVIPFIAPEIFCGDAPTRESDVYSFGMVMWMVSSGVRPHYDKSHDILLTQDVCIGLRPSLVDGTPPVFAKLMLQCLDDNPSNRPTASHLYECLENWISQICDDPQPNILSDEFDKAEEVKFHKMIRSGDFVVPQCHKNSFYFSRPLTTLNVKTL